jgi:signal peptidase I
MTTVLLLGLCLILQLGLNALLLWGVVKLWRVERATMARAFVAVLIQVVLGIAFAVFAQRLASPATVGWAVAVLAAQVAVFVLLTWAIIGLLFRSSAGKSVGVAVSYLAGATVLGLAAYFSLTQVARAYVVSSGSMAPTLRGEHVTAICPHCQGEAFVSVRPPTDELPWRAAEHEPANGICSQCRSISEFRGVRREVRGADRFICNRLLTPERWDVIVFRYLREPSSLYVYRLVGLPGETVEIKEQSVWINGVKMEPPAELRGIRYDESPIPGLKPPKAEWGLGPDDFFVLGDFTTNSSDSRLWGPVPRDHLEAVATLIYWPPSRWRVLR